MDRLNWEEGGRANVCVRACDFILRECAGSSRQKEMIIYVRESSGGCWGGQEAWTKVLLHGKVLHSKGGGGSLQSTV